MTNDKIYKGSCFCGAVRFVVKGEPVAGGFCHCRSCRAWSGCPVNAFTLWTPDAVTITRGEELVATYNKTERSHRKWCISCGGHVMNEHPTWGVVDVPVATLLEFPFRPDLHVNYGETVHPMRDGLPKHRDLPRDMGGSGLVVAE